MINFDSLSLKAFIAEYKNVLTDARVFKIQQPTRHDLILTIKNHKLYINVNPKYPHLAVMSKECQDLRSIEIPKAPPMFCMLLRKYLEGSRIKDIKQPEFERIFEIYFETYGELGERVPMVLSCEFMGKYSNIILYNYDTNVIIGCAHNVGSEKSRERELAGGLPYVYPPRQNKIDINKVSEEEFLSLIKVESLENFGYISRALAVELINSCKPGDLYNIAKETVNLRNLNPGISKNMRFYSLVCLDKTIEWQNVDSVNEMLDRYFAHQVFEDKFNGLKNLLFKSNKKDLKQARKLFEDQEKIAQNQDKQEKYKQQADELLVENPKEAQKYYKLYKKAKTAAKHSEEMLEKTRQEIHYLESIEDSINKAETLQDLKDIQKDSSAPPQNDDYVSNLAEFISSDGLTIYAGKNNRQNEYILKHSSPEDTWLHVQNIPGSHVIIKGHKIPETTLHEAAYIAVWYSKAQQSSNVPVVFTKRKYVKKPSGSKPGFVVYNNEKTLWVNPDEEKVRKLRKYGK